jgi:2,4-dichlorophenol 6-monooxygenase
MAFERLFSDTPGGHTAQAILAEAMKIQRIGPQAHDMEIGYAYESGALVGDGSLPPPRDPMAGIYHPTTRPGSRLPHAPLVREGQTISTHDLITPGQWVLLCSDILWRPVVAAVAPSDGNQLHCKVIAQMGDCQDEYGAWQALRQVSETGAVLVRPDGHVAWRVEQVPNDPRGVLVNAWMCCTSTVAI